MRFDKLDLNLLVALDALLEDRNVSWAARRLCLSQPALSGALNRLRYYFKDELLVQSGRQMILTPKAEELAVSVREALTLIRAKITSPAAFDPETAERRFSIVCSDDACDVLVAEAIREAARRAPGLTFELMPTDLKAVDRLERGEVDLMISVPRYMAHHHPRIPLFEDEHAVICWNQGRYAAGLGADDFLAAGHAVVVFGPEKHPAFTESHFMEQGVSRRLEVQVPSFSALPQAVIGTDRLATIYRRHAEYFARGLPIRVHRAPVPLPNVQEEAQWHGMREKDHGLRWLLDILKAKGAELAASSCERAA